LWGSERAAVDSTDRLVEDALTGVRLRPRPRAVAALKDVDLEPLLFASSERRRAWRAPEPPAANDYAADDSGEPLSFTLRGSRVTLEEYALETLTDERSDERRAQVIAALAKNGARVSGRVEVSQAAKDVLYDWPVIARLGEER